LRSLNAIPAWSKILLLHIFFFGWQSALSAQESRIDLESKRKELIEAIEETSNELKETRQTRQATLNRFLILRRSIQQRNQLISTLEQEIAYTNASVERTEQVLTSLEDDLVRLRSEYKVLLRTALRHKLSQSYLQFLFSSRNLNEAFQRWQYIRQYERYRKRQASLILETKKTLQEKAAQLAADRIGKDSLLQEMRSQQIIMESELNDKNQLLVTLQSDEKRLASELEKQEKAHQQLNAMIENVIREEMLAKRKRSRTRAALEDANPPEEVEATPESSDANFGQQRGRLPWPVADGQIIKPFGIHYHPKFKEVRLTNNGIDIRTAARSGVRAVFSGRVAGTQFIPGYQNTVIVQHGEYYTVYSNLAEIYVQRGDKITQNQEIGRLDAERPEIHFEVWREKKRLNPEDWVTR
jgi:septal ring factor EnvC (AmiA/AmiB activator)